MDCGLEDAILSDDHLRADSVEGHCDVGKHYRLRDDIHLRIVHTARKRGGPDHIAHRGSGGLVHEHQPQRISLSERFLATGSLE